MSDHYRRPDYERGAGLIIIFAICFLVMMGGVVGCVVGRFLL